MLSTNTFGHSTTLAVMNPTSVVRPLAEYWAMSNSAPRNVPALASSIQPKPRLAGSAPSAVTTSACSGELKTRNRSPSQSAGPSRGAAVANGRRNGPTARPSPTTPEPASRSLTASAIGDVTSAFSAA